MIQSKRDSTLRNQTPRGQKTNKYEKKLIFFSTIPIKYSILIMFFCRQGWQNDSKKEKGQSKQQGESESILFLKNSQFAKKVEKFTEKYISKILALIACTNALNTVTFLTQIINCFLRSEKNSTSVHLRSRNLSSPKF